MSIFDVSMPSMNMEPSVSANRKSAAISDDFPAPVRPTTPTFRQSINLCYIIGIMIQKIMDEPIYQIPLIVIL